MTMNATNRRLVVAGPSAEVSWFIERARGPLQPPDEPSNPWRERLAISFKALADLVPKPERPSEVPADIDRTWLDRVWESRDGMSRAVWVLTDEELIDDEALEHLLRAISARYRRVCLVSAWDDPDNVEAASTLFWRGRVRRYRLSEAAKRRILRTCYGRHGVRYTEATVEDDSVDEDVHIAAMADADMAMLDAVERHWDRRIEALLCPPRSAPRAPRPRRAPRE